jgi:hypothetical protein
MSKNIPLTGSKEIQVIGSSHITNW